MSFGDDKDGVVRYQFADEQYRDHLYVLASDYDALEAKCDALKAENEQAKMVLGAAKAFMTQQSQHVKKLEAERDGINEAVALYYQRHCSLSPATVIKDLAERLKRCNAALELGTEMLRGRR